MTRSSTAPGDSLKHASDRGAIGSLLGRLVERGLLDERDLVEGDVRVVDASRRNRNLRVTTTLGKRYFVKQALGAERSLSIGREAAFLRLTAAPPLDARLGAYLPAVRDWDAAHGTLVFDLVPESSSLAEHHRRLRRWPASLAGQAGAALAALHREPPTRALADEIALAGLGSPWVLALHQPSIDFLDHVSGAGLELIRIVQAAPSLGAALDDLRHAWQPTAIVHGDIKWDNFVVSPASRGRGRRLRLVDWELVRPGDPLWDAASFLSQYLDAWIASIHIVIAQ